MKIARPDFGRLLAAVQLREPDRVPLAEILIAREIQSQFLGRTVAEDDLASQVEFWADAGYDYIPITVGMMTPGGVTKDSLISKALARVVEEQALCDNDAWNLEKRSWIQDEESFQRFPWEAVANPDNSAVHEAERYLQPGMKIVALCGKIFTLTWMLLGFENFCMSLVTRPRLVAKVFDRVAEIQQAALRTAYASDAVAAVWVVDDLAFGSGPMIDPREFRRYLFPRYKDMADQCHASGRCFFFHSDGLLWDLMDDLLEIGIDALHPIDPTCMDILEVKQRVGSRLCLFGNIPNEALMLAQPEQIVALVKDRLECIAPGGGYALGAGNSIPEWTKFENFMAMRNTALTFGAYPIS